MTKRTKAVDVASKLDVLDRMVLGMKSQREALDSRLAETRTVLEELKALDTDGVFKKEEDRWKFRETLNTALDL